MAKHWTGRQTWHCFAHMKTIKALILYMYREGKGLVCFITEWIWKINVGSISKNLGGMIFSVFTKMKSWIFLPQRNDKYLKK